MRINNPHYKKKPIKRDYSHKPKCEEQDCPKYAYQDNKYCFQHKEMLLNIPLTPEEQEALAQAVHKASLNNIKLLIHLMTETPGMSRPERRLRLAQERGALPEESEE